MTKKGDKYIETIGRRKTSTSRVRISPASKMSFVVNDKKHADYFNAEQTKRVIEEPFTKLKLEKFFEVTAIVSGGGAKSQAEAIRHGIARALVAFDESLKSEIKKLGFLKRDPRAKERRKAGLAGKARKRKQWSKR